MTGSIENVLREITGDPDMVRYFKKEREYIIEIELYVSRKHLQRQKEKPAEEEKAGLTIPNICNIC